MKSRARGTKSLYVLRVDLRRSLAYDENAVRAGGHYSEYRHYTRDQTVVSGIIRHLRSIRLQYVLFRDSHNIRARLYIHSRGTRTSRASRARSRDGSGRLLAARIILIVVGSRQGRRANRGHATREAGKTRDQRLYALSQIVQSRERRQTVQRVYGNMRDVPSRVTYRGRGVLSRAKDLQRQRVTRYANRNRTSYARPSVNGRLIPTMFVHVHVCRYSSGQVISYIPSLRSRRGKYRRMIISPRGLHPVGHRMAFRHGARVTTGIAHYMYGFVARSGPYEHVRY